MTPDVTQIVVILSKFAKRRVRFSDVSCAPTIARQTTHLDDGSRCEPVSNRAYFGTQHAHEEIHEAKHFPSMPGGCGGTLEPIRGVVSFGEPLTELTTDRSKKPSMPRPRARVRVRKHHATGAWRTSVGLCRHLSKRNVIIHIVKATRRLRLRWSRTGSGGGRRRT